MLKTFSRPIGTIYGRPIEAAMKRLLIVPLIAIIGSIWIAVAVTAHQASGIIAPAIADNLVADSPMEQIMRAREVDAAAARGGGGWAWAAFGVLLCGSVAIGGMAVATPFLKQGRLSLKSLQRRRRPQQPSPTVSQVPRISQVPQLTEGGQWEDSQSQRF